jgi:hypothetical protein
VHLHGSYPTSTSSHLDGENRRLFEHGEPLPTSIDSHERLPAGRVPQAERGSSDDLTSEARALLRLAALREEKPAERARAFAAAVLAESDVGRWALAVLRGEPLAARALVELATVRLQQTTTDGAPASDARRAARKTGRR